MPQEQAPFSGLKWNEVTWYSKLGAIILFLGVVPALCFYIGTQYAEITNVPLIASSAQGIISSDHAIAIVKNDPDVQAWLKSFTFTGQPGEEGDDQAYIDPKTGGWPSFTIIARSGDFYVIEAFENFETNTIKFLGLYSVNKHTGKEQPYSNACWGIPNGQCRE